MFALQVASKSRSGKGSGAIVKAYQASSGGHKSPKGAPLDGWFWGFVGVAIFATSLPVTRMAVTELHPALVGIGRAAAAAIPAIAVLLIFDRTRPSLLEALKMLGAGLGIVVGFPLFTALAMTDLPASHGGVVLGLLPLATAAMAMIVAGERPSGAFWLWAVLGSALVVTFALWESGWQILAADLWLVAAVLSAAFAYAVSGKLARTRPAWWVICWTLSLMLPLSGTVALLNWPDADVAITSWLAFGWGAMMPQFIAFFAWNHGLARGGIARIGQVQLLQVFMTFGFAAWLLNEGVGWRTLVFAVAVTACVLMGKRTKIS